MGEYYTLVNLTKKEQISFEKLPVAKKREIAGNPASAAIVSWYLLEHSGDRIGFIGDESPSPFPDIEYGSIINYPDRTQDLIEELIKKGILTDCGIAYRDEDDPSIYSRDIRNSMMPEELLIPKKTTVEPSSGGNSE